MNETVCFHPDLLPESADPAGSTRYSDVQIMRFEIPCREYGMYEQFYEDEKLFAVYVCSPEYEKANCKSFKGTVLKEVNGFSWWESIKKGE